ncbi:Cytochrome-P450 [Teratosphaeria destructans]|uniref:Cytochrome-P450 n=1 Tax=Teratosphaeria destructans TaxID=418781 RepID=A0A9W7W768_9PEZI|nr:Cytochrome-P450 [Teratosphaeria destructans]
MSSSSSSSPSSSSSSSAPKSPQRATAEALVQAFNDMDIDRIIACRSRDCRRIILPASLRHPPTDNQQYERSLRQLKAIFHNFELTVRDWLEDVPARRIVMYLQARADTEAGEYVNEYMWTLDFDESGERVVRSTEFVDAVVNVQFWPKLAAAMRRHAEQQGVTMAGER